MADLAGHRCYFDNAATSWPKPPAVAAAMAASAERLTASPGRGAYREVRQATDIMERCRTRLATLIGVEEAASIAWTLNCTDALTLAIEGSARHARRASQTVHIVTTAMDHNSVLRPLHGLQADGVRMTVVPADPATGLVDPDDVHHAIEPDTVLVAIAHGSNVSGTIQPIARIGDRCRHHAVPLLVDAAQTLGRRCIDVEAMNIDLLAFPGHKSLLGPLGTGGLWIRPGLETKVDPVRLGGTGSRSDLPVQPETLPDRYEAGSHNMPGIAGLEAALGWILEQGVSRLHRRDEVLTARLLERLLTLDHIHVIGPHDTEDRCAVFSVTCDHLSPEAMATALERRGILTRSGIHCAPWAHRTFGTLDSGGTLRLSAGTFTTDDDIDAAADALKSVASPKTASPTHAQAVTAG